jgi:hypothetical protein
MKFAVLTVRCAWFGAFCADAQAADVTGTVRDDTKGALPGVAVELRTHGAAPSLTVTDHQGT